MSSKPHVGIPPNTTLALSEAECVTLCLTFSDWVRPCLFVSVCVFACVWVCVFKRMCAVSELVSLSNLPWPLLSRPCLKWETPDVELWTCTPLRAGYGWEMLRRGGHVRPRGWKEGQECTNILIFQGFWHWAWVFRMMCVDVYMRACVRACVFDLVPGLDLNASYLKTALSVAAWSGFSTLGDLSKLKGKRLKADSCRTSRVQSNFFDNFVSVIGSISRWVYVFVNANTCVMSFSALLKKKNQFNTI